jgi:hypothetical protein
VKPVKNTGMVPGVFWGLLRKPDGMPCLFGSKQDAEENRDYDEYAVEVRVYPASAMALLRGRQELLRRKKEAAKAKSRPRVPVEQKRKRGSVVMAGFGQLQRAVKKLEPKVRRELREHLDEALGRPKRKPGGRRAAAPRVRR